ncbi:MAG: hypothetical protein EON47_18430, partial [Acetobacteraceae bacterium]
SVTQRDTTPLVVGQRVLVISGNQARIVPDYTTQPPATPAAAAAAGAAVHPAAVAPAAASPVLSPPPVPPPPVIVPPPPPPLSEAPAAASDSTMSQAVQSALTAQLPPVAQGAAAQGAIQDATRSLMP